MLKSVKKLLKFAKKFLALPPPDQCPRRTKSFSRIFSALFEIGLFDHRRLVRVFFECIGNAEFIATNDHDYFKSRISNLQYHLYPKNMRGLPHNVFQS